MPKKRSLIAIANEQVSIVYACTLIGMSVPEIPSGKSVKLHCPFGTVYHSDHGVETAFRVYPDSNSVWCFACSEYNTPVSLVSKAWDRPQQDVAVDLLDRIGYKPVSIAQAWAQVSVKEIPPDISALGLALRTYCSRLVEDWDVRQFDADISKVLDKCLALLTQVSNEEAAEKWLETTKQVMRSALEKEV